MALAGDSVQRSRWRPSGVLAPVLILALVFGVLFYSFVKNEDCLEIGVDGALFSGYLEKRPSDHALFAQTGVDPLRGGFDAFYPLVREYLVPGLLTLPFADGIPNKPLAYFLYTPAIILGFFLLARALAIGWSAAILAGFLCSIFLLPGIVHHFGTVQGNLHLNPHWSQDLFLSLLIVAAFWTLDGEWRLRNVLLLFVPLLCFVWTAVSTGPQLFFMMPALAVYAGASLLDARRISDDLQRVLAAAIALLGVAGLGIATFYYGLVEYSPFHFFADQLKAHPVAWHFVSAFFWIEPMGRWLVILGILGALWTLWGARGRLRLFAAVHLGVKLVYFPLAYWLVFQATNYHGSLPSYFEMFILLYDFLFTAVLITDGARLVGRGIARLAPRIGGWSDSASAAAALVAAVAVVAFYNVDEALSFPQKQCPARGFNPIVASPIIDTLRHDIALKPGSTFNGLAATVTGVDARASMTWEDLAAHDYWLWVAAGNDYRTVGLWDFGIPTLFQLFTFTAPPYFLLTTDFLARPADVQTRSELVFTRVNEKMMELWGVRYLISDLADPPGKPAGAVPVNYKLPAVKSETIRLSAFPDPNLGNYSPTEVLRRPDFRSGRAVLRDPRFDGRQTVVTDAAIEGSYVPADNVTLVYQKYGFDLRARSAGQSILVLPVVYSHCWSIEGGSATLFRANLMQMGVRFSGALDVRLVFRYGPIWAGSCRLEDLGDMTRLDIADARPQPRSAP